MSRCPPLPLSDRRVIFICTSETSEYIRELYRSFQEISICQSIILTLYIHYGRLCICKYANAPEHWNGVGPATVETMERKTAMVRAYTSGLGVHVDEQNLSREGWSVEPAVKAEQQVNRLARVRASFTRTPPAARHLVTDSRWRPS